MQNLITEYTPGMTIEPPMIVANMPNEAYHSAPGISKSGLDLIARSPAHFMASVPRPSTRNMEIGTAIHTAVLEPNRFEQDYVLLEDVKDRRASEYKQAKEVHGGAFVLTGPESAHVSSLQAAVHANVAIPDGYTEVSVFARNSNGTLLKCRFDRLTDDLQAIDLKKTIDSRPRPFSKAINNYRYHVQAAFYSHVFKLATGLDLAAFKFLAVESEPPHAPVMYSLGHDTMLLGQELFERDVTTYEDCIRHDHWPMYEGVSGTIDVPDWAFDDHQDDEINEIF